MRCCPGRGSGEPATREYQLHRIVSVEWPVNASKKSPGRPSPTAQAAVMRWARATAASKYATPAVRSSGTSAGQMLGAKMRSRSAATAGLVRSGSSGPKLKASNRSGGASTPRLYASDSAPIAE